jgi:hypothetical protein
MKTRSAVLTLVATLLCSTLSAQSIPSTQDTVFVYSYDASGNRIKRELFIVDDVHIPIEPILPPIDPDPENTLGLNIYPNPTNGVFTLNVDNLPAITTNTPTAIMIFNSNQSIVLNVDEVASTQVLNISGNPPGYYFVIVRIGKTAEYITVIKQ